MSRVQLALNVGELDAAVAFYSKLFSTEPAELRDGYANFAVVEPPLELVLFEQPGKGGTLNHLGVEVETTDEVGAAQTRLAESGLATSVEDGVACCYARQDKVWVDGPSGEPWEIYSVLEDVEMPAGQLRMVDPETGASCCAVVAGTASRRPARRLAADESRPVLADLGRRALAEALGTALLVLAVVGSGIAAARLSPGEVGLQLLGNAAATAAALVAIILAVGPVSGAHLNPAVTLATRAFGGLTTREAGTYAGAQVVGGAAGAVLANVMFSVPALDLSTKVRSSGALWSSEAVATFGLLLVIFGVVRSGRTSAAPFAVGAYIGGAYLFTSSTSFANPAVTLARTLSDTFAGIAPSSVPPFVIAQIIGAGVAVAAINALYPSVSAAAADAVVPHEPSQARPPRGPALVDPDTNRRS